MESGGSYKLLLPGKPVSLTVPKTDELKFNLGNHRISFNLNKDLQKNLEIYSQASRSISTG